MLCEGDTFLFKAGQQRSAKESSRPRVQGKEKTSQLMCLGNAYLGHLSWSPENPDQAETRELVAHFRACFQTTQAIISEGLKQTAAW